MAKARTKNPQFDCVLLFLADCEVATFFFNPFYIAPKSQNNRNLLVDRISILAHAVPKLPILVLAYRYVEKFTEFLQLFVSIHLRRFEANSNFPVLEFLTLLFKYTFQQVSQSESLKFGFQ